MSNATFRKLMIEWEANYDYNEPFKEYMNANFPHHKDMYGLESFRIEDIQAARKFWKQKAKNDANFMWFADYQDAYDYIDNLPVCRYDEEG